MQDSTKHSSGALRGLALVAALLVGATLVFSGITKILSPKAFVATVDSYGVLPSWLVLPGTTGLVGVEFALGLLLVLGFRRRLAAWLTLPLVLFFTAMVVHAMRVGLSECGCFGEVISLSPMQELFVDLALLALTLVVLWKGEDIEAGRAVAAPLGWVTLCLGAAAFLAAGPVVGAESQLEVETSQLEALASGQPPLQLEDEAFLFFFSADCDHCWSYVGAVELMQERLEGISVHGVTFSDPVALAAFETAFAPGFPIHVVSESVFHRVTTEYPAAIWVSGGEVAKTWSGFVPSHREIAESGGYLYRPAGQEPAAAEPAAPATNGNLFGGPVRGRH